MIQPKGKAVGKKITKAAWPNYQRRTTFIILPATFTFNRDRSGVVRVAETGRTHFRTQDDTPELHHISFDRKI